MMVPHWWRISEDQSRSSSFCCWTKHGRCSQALLSQHRAAPFCSETWTHIAMSLIHVLWNWIAEMRVPLGWRISKDQSRSSSFCCWTKHRKRSQALLSHRATHFYFETWTHVAMSLIHVLQNWNAEMRVPLGWRISKDQSRSSSFCCFPKRGKGQLSSSQPPSSSFH
jgi:uncharacterized protein YbdZ (MbtH family)